MSLPFAVPGWVYLVKSPLTRCLDALAQPTDRPSLYQIAITHPTQFSCLSSTVSASLSAMSVPNPKNANDRLLACLVDEDDTDDSD